MDNNLISRLTTNIDNNQDLNISPENAAILLFSDIKELLDLTPEMRKQILSKWKYYNNFLLTINFHSNNQQVNKYVSWEESFTLCLLYNIFH